MTDSISFVRLAPDMAAEPDPDDLQDLKNLVERNAEALKRLREMIDNLESLLASRPDSCEEGGKILPPNEPGGDQAGPPG